MLSYDTFLFFTLLMVPVLKAWYSSSDPQVRDPTVPVLLYAALVYVLPWFISTGFLWAAALAVLAYQAMQGPLSVPQEWPALKEYQPALFQHSRAAHGYLVEHKGKVGLPPWAERFLLGLLFEVSLLLDPSLTRHHKVERYRLAGVALAYHYSKPIIDRIQTNPASTP